MTIVVDWDVKNQTKKSSLVVTSWERADLLALLYAMYCCHFPIWCLGPVWYLIVSIPDLCLLPYLNCNTTKMCVCLDGLLYLNITSEFTLQVCL